MLTHAFGFNSTENTIPAGLIIFLNDTTAPAGWTLYTSADGHFIMGADQGETNYEIGDDVTGSGIADMAVGLAGDHAWNIGATYTTRKSTQPSTGAPNGVQETSGAHTHDDVSLSVYEPEHNTLRLIQSDIDTSILPPKTVFLSATGTDLSSKFTALNTDNKMLKIDSTIGSGGGDVPATESGSGDGGMYHGHWTGTGGSTNSGISAYSQTSINGMAHSHNTSITVTPAIKRKILAAWTNASSFAVSSVNETIIALWDQAIAPDKWSLCDGTSGTIDLSQYAIELSDHNSINTSGIGNNTITTSGSLDSTDWPHSHVLTTYLAQYSGTGGHDTANAPHGHTLTGVTDAAYIPDYFCLQFIQYTG